MIKRATWGDVEKVKQIHESQYEFDFPSPDKFLETFVITDEQNEIITFGGARLILEVIAVTDKNQSSRKRHDALIQLLNTVKESARKNEFDQLHSFIGHDLTWKKALTKHGFVPCKGEALVIGIE